MKKEINITKAPASSGRRKIRNDIIFIFALLLLVSLASLALFLFRTPGDTVVVTVDGQKFGEYLLSEDKEIEIRRKGGYNLLVIEDGKAYVRHASCPDGICSSHSPIQHDGESIICLPNRVVIEVRALSKDQPDIIT